METQSPLQKTMGYLEKSIDIIYEEICSPSIDSELKAKRMYLLAQLITALVKLRETAGKEPTADEKLVDLINKVPLTVRRAVVRETGLTFRRKR